METQEEASSRSLFCNYCQRWNYDNKTKLLFLFKQNLLFERPNVGAVTPPPCGNLLNTTRMMEPCFPRYRPATPTLTRNQGRGVSDRLHPHLDVAFNNTCPLQPLVLGDTDLLPDVLQVVQRFVQARHHLCRQHLTTDNREVNLIKLVRGKKRGFLHVNAS